VGIDVIGKLGVAFDTNGVASLIVTGSAVGDLPSGDAAVEIRGPFVVEVRRVGRGRVELRNVGYVGDPVGAMAGFAETGTMAGNAQGRIVTGLDEMP